MTAIEKLEAWIRDNTPSDDPSHDFAHISRVYAWAVRMGQELGAEMDVIAPAALLHDVVSVPKNHPDRARAAEMAAQKARGILKDFGWSEEKIARITTVIAEHSFSAGKAPTSLESQILQDADRLDAIGSIGIARVFSCATKMASSFYDFNDPWAERRALDDKRFALDHFYVKLLKLAPRMNTEPGRKEARKRQELMERFIAQLEDEMKPCTKEMSPIAPNPRLTNQ